VRELARFLKGQINSTAVADIWRSARRPRAVDRWERAGRPVPPPPEYKHQALLDYADSYGLDTLVETGTFWGQTVAAMRRHFRRVMSIELEPRLASRARRRFRRFRNVEIIEGDSGRELAGVVRRLDSPALFWLDGHDSGGETAATEPLREELEALMRSPEGSVGLIDDARTFTGPPRMTLAQIEEATQGRFAMEVRDDVIRLTPR
jgi:LmbE family N-acetylglucosaminyl deacetylase